MKKTGFILIAMVFTISFAFAQGNGQTKGNGTGNGNSPFWRLDGNGGTDISNPHFVGTLDLMGLAFRTDNLERMRITASGDVGVGLTAPQAKLHVGGNLFVDQKTKTNAFQMPTGAMDEYVLMSDNLGNGTWVDPDTFAQELIWDAPNNLLSITDGNTVDLSDLLQSLSINYGTDMLSLSEGGAVSLGVYRQDLSFNAGTNFLSISGGTGTDLSALDDGWAYASGSGTTGDIYHTGDVAIGANNFATGYALSVDGSIVCEEVLVEISGSWPDYVFSNEYKLMPLDELERQIQQLRHLPGIPSASQVDQEGVKLGDMQHRFLEKIEELTLYTIEQQKQLQSQGAQINALMEEVRNLKQQLENK